MIREIERIEVLSKSIYVKEKYGGLVFLAEYNIKDDKLLRNFEKRLGIGNRSIYYDEMQNLSFIRSSSKGL